MQITAGTTDVSIPIYCRTTAGVALTGKVAANFVLTYRRDGANVAISLSDLSAIDDAHSDGGIFEVGNGEYRLDLPDAACVAGAINVTVGGTVAGGVVLGYPIALTDDNAAAIDRNAALIESHRRHQVTGDVYYLDPVNGASHAAGNRGGKSDPYASVQDWHDNACTDWNGDMLRLVPGATGTITTLTEQVTLTKNAFCIRGPGDTFLWTFGSNGDVITSSGQNVELTGFRFATHSTGSGDGIVISGDETWVHGTRCDSARENGIEIDDANFCWIENNVLHSVGANASAAAIKISSSVGASNNHIVDNRIYDTTGDGVHIEGATTDQTVIKDNVIEGSSAFGISIGTGVTTTQVFGNHLDNNASGAIDDGGTNTNAENNEQWAKHSIATEARLAQLDEANIPGDVDAVPTTAQIVTAMESLAGDTGITLAKALEMLAAFMAGKVTATSDGTTTTYTYLKRDGTTTSFTSACTEADGLRASTGALS